MTRAKSDVRAAHGNAARLGRLVVLENGRDRGLSPAASPAEPARPDRDDAGRFLPGNTWSRMAKYRAGPTGVLAKLEAGADPSWRASRRAGRRAGGHRIQELSRIHGGELSSAVCRLVMSACSLSADAEYLRARAAADNAPDLLRIAATLDAGSRQAERDAWEMAVREAAARPRESHQARLVRELREIEAEDRKVRVDPAESKPLPADSEIEIVPLTPAGERFAHDWATAEGSDQ